MSGSMFSAPGGTGQSSNAAEDPAQAQSRVNHSLELIRTCDQDLQLLIQLRSDNLTLLEKQQTELQRVNQVIEKAHEGLAEARRIVATCRPRSVGGNPLLRQRMRWRLVDSKEFHSFEPVISRQNAAVLHEANLLRQPGRWGSGGGKDNGSRGTGPVQKIDNIELLGGLLGNMSARSNNMNQRPRSPLPQPVGNRNAPIDRMRTPLSTTTSLPPYDESRSPFWPQSSPRSEPQIAIPMSAPPRMGHEPDDKQVAQPQRHSISEGQRTVMGDNGNEGLALLFRQPSDRRSISYSPSDALSSTTTLVSREASQLSTARSTPKPYKYPDSYHELPGLSTFSGSTTPGSYHELSGVTRTHELPADINIRGGGYNSGMGQLSPTDRRQLSNAPSLGSLTSHPSIQSLRDQPAPSISAPRSMPIPELQGTQMSPEVERIDVGSTRIYITSSSAARSDGQLQRPPLRPVSASSEVRCASCRSLPTAMDFAMRNPSRPQGFNPYDRGHLSTRSQTSSSIVQHSTPQSQDFVSPQQSMDFVSPEQRQAFVSPQQSQDLAAPQQPHSCCGCCEHSRLGTPRETYSTLDQSSPQTQSMKYGYQEQTFHAELPG